MALFPRAAAAAVALASALLLIAARVAPAAGTNYCGTTYAAAAASCSRPCPIGVDSECGSGETCFADVVCKHIKWCGTSWTAALASCRRACPGGTDSECGCGERCYADVDCGDGAPAPPAVGSPPTACSSAVHLGYFASWSTGRPCSGFTDATLAAVAGRYTHLAWSFAAVAADGRLIPVEAGDPERWRAFNDMVKRSNPAVRTDLSVGGWSFNSGATATRWSNMAASPAARSAFAASAVTALRAAGMDGLDIDWEFPGASDRGGRPTDRVNLVALVQELRAAFDASPGSRLRLTIAIPASTYYSGGYDLRALARHVDWFNLMSYDLAGGGGVTGAHTGMTPIRAAVSRVRAAGVPASQIVLGIAAYGRTWTLTDSDACAASGGQSCAATGTGRPGTCSAEAGFLSDREITAVSAAGSGGRVNSGTVDGAAWTIFGGDQYVSHDTAATLGIKRAFVQEARLRGTMVWSVDQVV